MAASQSGKSGAANTPSTKPAENDNISGKVISEVQACILLQRWVICGSMIMFSQLKLCELNDLLMRLLTSSFMARVDGSQCFKKVTLSGSVLNWGTIVSETSNKWTRAKEVSIKKG
ncbi:hypothetical protein AK812_SmicGene33137 [Symbiodinium microadriaticum]|uniref:Uncharacterized protein n=1 Tax=Symbiodinium microadriaticum TaxID=2951 RepID=A0A1Q9CSE4_SYMMI|nr:hypothetical protein AK812_SmicGene33137 [Symbiodinium microadriaticum]